MKQLITAALVAAPFDDAQGAPSEIIYLPEGDNPITATVDGEPKTILVRVPRERGQEIASKLQADLQKRHAENVRPWFSFQHQAGPASALPKSFRYEPGQGVIVAVEWTGAGKAAIEGKDFSYFSPTFLMADDGTPDGLPTKGEFGALVNEPAFRNIQRIAAADAGGVGMNGDSALDKIEAAARHLVASGQAATYNDGVTMAVNRNPELYQAVMCADPIKKDALLATAEKKEGEKVSAKQQLERLRDEIYLKGEKPTEVDAMVEAAMRRPDLYQQWVDLEGEDVESQMKELTLPSSMRNAGASDFEGKAKQLVSSGQAKTLDEAFGQVAAADPTAYSSYLSTLVR